MPTDSRSLVYLDTSAYLAILLREAGHDKFLKPAANRRVCSSILLALETQRCLIRLAREKELAPPELEKSAKRFESDLDLFIFRDVTRELCLSREYPAVLTPKSLDLVHLRTALWFHTNMGLVRFISKDENQLRAAEEFGLPI